MFRLLTRRSLLRRTSAPTEIIGLRELSSSAQAVPNLRSKQNPPGSSTSTSPFTGPRLPFTPPQPNSSQPFTPRTDNKSTASGPGSVNGQAKSSPLSSPFAFRENASPRLPGQTRPPQPSPNASPQQGGGQQKPNMNAPFGSAQQSQAGVGFKPGMSFGPNVGMASPPTPFGVATKSNVPGGRPTGPASSPFGGLGGMGGFGPAFSNPTAKPANVGSNATGATSTSPPASPFAAIPGAFGRGPATAGTNPLAGGSFAANPFFTARGGAPPAPGSLASRLAGLADSATANAKLGGGMRPQQPDGTAGSGAPWDLQTMLSQLATARRPGQAPVSHNGSPQDTQQQNQFNQPSKASETQNVRRTIGAPGTGTGGMSQFQGLFQSLMQRNGAMNEDEFKKSKTTSMSSQSQSAASAASANSGILPFPSPASNDAGGSMFKTLIGSLDPEKQEERRRKRQAKYEARLEEIKAQERERLEREEENKLNRLIRSENKRRVPVAAVQSVLQFCKRSHLPRRAVMDYLYQQDGVKRLPSSLMTAAQAEELLTLHGIEANFFDINATSAAMELVAAAAEDDGRPVRAPVICIMGHVDHGKTTLLDALRRTNIAENEAGRITQSIGAFPVPVPEELADIIPGLTFLDTPGHAVFKNMRSRGSSPTVTDIVVLVISAADGVQLQTKEAVKLAVESERPLIVAITKCDIPGVDPDKIRKELLDECGVQTEHLGGTVTSVPVSAITGEGIGDLLEAIALIAQPLNLKYTERKEIPKSTVDAIKRDYRRCRKENAPFDSDLSEVIMGMASVVEAHVGRGQGPLLNVIVRQGEIRVGDVIICGEEIGTIKSMRNSKGDLIKSASALKSEPVQIMGIEGFEALSEELLVLPALEIAEIMKELRHLRDSADEMMDQSLDWDKQRNAKMKNKPLRAARLFGKDSERPALSIDDDDAGMDFDGTQDGDGRRKGKQKEKKERTVDSNREHIEREKKLAEARRVFEEEQARVLRVYVKGDVLGSLETVQQYFNDLSKSQHAGLVQVKLVKSALGDITESDVLYALRTGAHLFGFNVKANAKAAQLGKEKGVPIFAADVIFHVFDQIAAAIATRMPQYAYHEVSGVATVDKMIPISLSKLALRRLCAEMSPSADNLIEFHGEPVVCGSRVTQGEVRRGLQWQVRRDNEIVADSLDCVSLRHIKTEMATIPKGKECGILLNNPSLIQPGDQIESYELKWCPVPFDDSYARGFDRSYWRAPKGYEPGKCKIRFPHEVHVSERKGRVGETAEGGVLRPELRGEESYKETSSEISKGSF